MSSFRHGRLRGLRRLKAEDKTRNIQIVMITGLSDLESKIMGVEQGADDFLVKPINKREIQARILALMRKKSYLDQICAHYEMALSSAIMDDLNGLYNRAYFINSLGTRNQAVPSARNIPLPSP